MISSNSLAAFTAEVSRSAGIQAGVQATRATPANYGGERARQGVEERRFESVPPRPTTTPPRGSLLDLSV